MSVIQSEKIDFVGKSKDNTKLSLVISDHLDWSDPKNEHLGILQNKLNDYLAFIESGELFEKYPIAKGKKIVIQIVAKYSLTDVAKQFYDKATSLIKNAGFTLEFKLSED